MKSKQPPHACVLPRDSDHTKSLVNLMYTRALEGYPPVPGKTVSWNVWEPSVLRGSFLLQVGQGALRAHVWSWFWGYLLHSARQEVKSGT